MFEHNSCLTMTPFRPESELICCADQSVGRGLLTTTYLTTISERAAFDRANNVTGLSHPPID